MDLILSTSSGIEETVLDYDFDIDLGEDNTFQISASYASWDKRIEIGKLVYIPGTEYGGVIKYISSSTNTGNIFIQGYTWRGYLAHRFIIPPSGEDYYFASGELNSIINNLINIPGFIISSADTGIYVNSHRFDRYESVLDGINKLLYIYDFRLEIKYVQTTNGGYVFIQAVKAGNYGGQVEFSQDSLIDFTSTDDQMGINHLICLGTGELRNRTVVHLYADRNGNVSQNQTLTGIDEITEVYDYSGAERENLIESGTKHLLERINKRSFVSEIKDVEQELFIGDIVSGQDYMTGQSIIEPIKEKIVKRTSGVISMDYQIEGEK